jgi:hypothetical protein
MEDILEINFHPEITVNQSMLNQVIMEKKAFMLTNDPMPELYDVSHTDGILLGETKQLQDLDLNIAFYAADKNFDNLDKIHRMLTTHTDDAYIFSEKEKARDWLRQEDQA